MISLPSFNLLWLLWIRIVIATQENGNKYPEEKRSHLQSILDDPNCVEFKNKNVCDVLKNEDILILECLQSLSQSQLSNINHECQNVIWDHTNKLLQNKRVRDLLLPNCKEELNTLKCNTDDSYLKCVLLNKEDIHNNDECLNMIDRLEGIAFQDFRLIQTFSEHCADYVKKFKCGRIDGYSFTQEPTLACLQDKIQNINGSCQKEIMELTEIQSNNIRLDHQLYVACKVDHSRYCDQYAAGSGRVFTCLMQQDQNRLSKECVSNLLRRQKLIAQDYKVSKGLMRACRSDIKRTHCRKQTSSDRTVRLAQILLCLEGFIKNGSTVDHECQREIIDHRRMLMEDYRLSPEIVNACKEDIRKSCTGFETGGKTIHCLMEQARVTKHSGRKLNDVCQRALETLVKETDVAEDWRVDPVLHEACSPVVETLCRHVKGGDARVMSCLMDNIGDEHMVEDCEDALMQIQYFVARDFKLDTQLYRACKDHAVNVCHADQNWDASQGTELGPSDSLQVFPCLYRYAYLDEVKMQLSKTCLQEMRRVMRQRAQSVELQPEIEEPCLMDLSEYCFDQTKKKEEMACLQKNMDQLTGTCRVAVERFTEVEAQHIELNHYIMTHCHNEMESLCHNELKNDEGDIMECLISHKNDAAVRAKPACRASIEHFQIISLSNYKFTYKFKMACKKHAMRFCTKSKTINEVIACLSERITNDTIRGEKSAVPKECRQQLKAQLFQQRENIDFDPKLKAACSKDINLYCSSIDHGNAQVLECLQSVHEKLSDKCEKEVFKVKKQEITDNSVDYALMTMCAGSIDQFCPHVEKEAVLECLKKHKDERGFNKKCHQIVLHRMIEQNNNYQLNPSLQENCRIDIKKFCSNLSPDKNEKDMTGPVIKCLKISFKHSILSDKCEKEMAYILREQALDINLNPLLRAVCKNEIETICKIDEEEHTEECLKTALINKKIATPMCQNEVANMIEESQADIQVDPLLQQACALDLLNHCREIPQGNGRHIKCLAEVASKKLTPECKDMLSKRLEMYKNAPQYALPEDLHQLYYQVVGSPSRHYFFLIIFMMICTIFLIGIFCGRVSRRHMQVKNK